MGLPVACATARRVSRSGVVAPRSQRETVIGATLTSAARCFCFQPRSARAGANAVAEITVGRPCGEYTASGCAGLDAD